MLTHQTHKPHSSVKEVLFARKELKILMAVDNVQKVTIALPILQKCCRQIQDFSLKVKVMKLKSLVELAHTRMNLLKPLAKIALLAINALMCK